jgi:hypothetical protein
LALSTGSVDSFCDLFGRDAGLVETADQLFHDLGRGRQRSWILEQGIKFHIYLLGDERVAIG